MVFHRMELQQTPIQTKVKAEIASSFWDVNDQQPSDTKDVSALDHYFRYYTFQNDIALNDQGRYVSVRTHRSIIEIAGLIKQDLGKAQLIQKLRRQHPSGPAITDESLNASVDLAARLILMVEIGNFRYSYSGQAGLTWEHGSLRSFVTNQFKPARCMSRDHVKLGKIFTARNLEIIAGIQIVWTDNLADHLRLKEHDTQLAIFHHASFLEVVQDR